MPITTSGNRLSKNALLQKSLKKEKSPAPEKSKLNYNEKKEYAQIERKISNLEEEIKRLTHLIDSPEIAQDAEKLRTLCSQVGLAENQLEQLYLRWDELSKKHST